MARNPPSLDLPSSFSDKTFRHIPKAFNARLQRVDDAIGGRISASGRYAYLNSEG